jgi:two-component system, cell cycle sensor histidine kinase and response regulator CckA
LLIYGKNISRNAFMNVLIADANNTSCDLLRTVLETEGHAVIVAANGREALELLERHPVDAVISDLLMPNLDGYRLCREIRQDKRWRDIPFICYTAIYGSPEDEKVAFDLGADAYLYKPSSRATILRVLHASTNGGRLAPKRPKASHTELDVLNVYSEPLVARLENKYFELSEKNRLAELTVEVGLAWTRRNELGEILQACAQSMVKHLDAALARIWMQNEAGAALELRASTATEEYPEGAQLGQPIAERIAQKRRPYHTNAVLGELNTGEQDWARREGVAAFAGHPLVIEDRVVGVMGVFTRREMPEATIKTLSDIADSLALGIQRKSAATVMGESEKRFRELAANVSDVFWLTHPGTGEVLFVSPAYETIWGRTCESLLEQPDSLFDAIHPDDRLRVLDTFKAESTEPSELEYRIVRPDDSERWIRGRTFPVRDAAGLVVRIAGVAEDVTEKRQWEIQLRQSQKMEAVGRLAGGVAHDFNNLLSVIVGHTALLGASPPSQQRLRDSVSEINGAVERAAAIIQQLLAFARRQVVEPKVLDVGSVLEESRSLLNRLIGEGVRLTMILPPGQKRVNIDPSQMNQVLVNLALNGRDAMSEGGELTVETRDVDFDAAGETIHPGTVSGRYVMLAVTDTGCGMTSEVQARIFEPFFSTKPDSTGLGLSVVDGIVKQNGGHVTVASRLGLGTTFNIYLPAAREQANGSSENTLPKPVRNSKTILLVEDEDPVREVTALLLQSLGYQVLQVSGAEEALNVVQSDRTKIDLLLTDVIMPGMSGRELADAFRVHDPQIKVLFQSGHTDDIVVRHGILNAEVAFLQKPYSIDTLAKKVRDLLV